MKHRQEKEGGGESSEQSQEKPSGGNQEKPGGRSKDKRRGRSQMGMTPWEENYELLLCEGLFSEYLEMGRFFHSPELSLVFQQLLVSWLNFYLVSTNSDPIWLHHHLCGGVPSGAAFCSY